MTGRGAGAAGAAGRASCRPGGGNLSISIAGLLLAIGMVSCAAGERTAARTGEGAAEAAALLDSLEVRTFRFFWELSEPATMLTPDRAPTKSFASISATGFALTAYVIGSERGYVSREDAAGRVRRTLDFLRSAPQDTMPAGSIGRRGFY